MDILKFIGEVRSPLKEMADCPRQEHEDAPEATIILYPPFLEGSRDIVQGEEILLLTWLHQADRNILVCNPRNDENAPLTGVFSTRSPHRPNPIGLHRVRVVSVGSNGSMIVAGLEVLDKTPVLDIKSLQNS